jgi:hypothetical protein
LTAGEIPGILPIRTGKFALAQPASGEQACRFFLLLSSAGWLFQKASLLFCVQEMAPTMKIALLSDIYGNSVLEQPRHPGARYIIQHLRGER